ncbi:MAG: hypothetical protein ACKV2T_29535 [Kofleriaceae bacterium]
MISLASVASSGCYRPDVGSCFLRCGANNTCPDGLACNPQGICASTQSTTCGGDLLDAGMDMTVPVLTTITLDVVDPDGAGQGGVDVIFSSPTGEVLETARTPTNGRLVVDGIPVGSMATIVRPTAVGVNATTHLDLWPDAHIVSRFATALGTSRFVTVNWQLPPNPPPTLFYFVYSTCFGGEQNTTNLTLDLAITTACPRLDVIVIAKNATLVPVFSASVANIDSGPVTITQSNWNAIAAGETIDVNLTNLAISARLELSGYVTPAYAYSTKMFDTTVGLDGVATLPFPSELGATAAVTARTTLGTDLVEQLYVERLPPGTTSFERDMGTRQFPWITDARLDLASKTLSWSVSNTNIVTQPAIASVRLSFRRNMDTHTWRIFGRGDRITSNTVGGKFALPELPGDNAFEPVAGDTNIGGEVMYFGLTPGLEDEVRGRLESHESRLDIFGIDGLNYIHRTTANVE